MKKKTNLLPAILLAFAVNSQAATLTWDGGGVGDAWTTADNWDPNTAPATASPFDDMIFGATAPGAITVAAGQNAQTLTFNANNVFDLQIASGQNLNLRGNTVTVTGGGNHVIGGPSNARLQLNSNSINVISVAPGSTLTFNNFGPNGRNVTYTGGGQITTTGTIFGYGNVIVDSGTTYILGGHAGNGGTSGNVRLSGGGAIQGSAAADPWRLQYGQGGASNNTDFSGSISGNIRFIKGRSNQGDTQTQTLSGINSYTGGTQIWAGTLRITGSHTGGDAYVVSANNSTGGILNLEGGTLSTPSVTLNKPGANAGTFLQSGSSTLTANDFVVSGGTTFTHTGGNQNIQNLFHLNGSGSLVVMDALPDSSDGSAILRYTIDTNGTTSPIDFTGSTNPFSRYGASAAAGVGPWAAEWEIDLVATSGIGVGGWASSIPLMTGFPLGTLSGQVTVHAFDAAGGPLTYNNLAHGQILYLTSPTTSIAGFTAKFDASGFSLEFGTAKAIPEPSTFGLIFLAGAMLSRKLRKWGRIQADWGDGSR